MSSLIIEAATVSPAREQPSGETSETPMLRRQRRLESFHVGCRAYVAGLTACSPELEDLADSFPALLYALVSGYGTATQRARAHRLVTSGSSLRQASDALELPFWLRKLPASAFGANIPVLPMDPEFGMRIASFIPRQSADAGPWLAALGAAATSAGPAYALWFARSVKPTYMSDESLLMMGAWAWYSGQPGTEGHKLLRRGWTSDISARRALDEFNVWRRRLRLVDTLGFGIADCWLREGSAGSFAFVPLRTVDDFLTESEHMENCLDQYADQLRSGRTVIFSIRRGHRHLACVEIGVHDEDCSMPMIAQLRAPRNRRASPEIWQATYAWMGSQKLLPRKLRTRIVQTAQKTLARQQLWQPYLEHLAGTELELRVRRVLMLPARRVRPHITSDPAQAVETAKTAGRIAAPVAPPLAKPCSNPA